MKKILSMITIFIMLFSLVAFADFGVIDRVLSTDIVCFIDEQPIKSYNISGYTYVIAEDLSGYGFNVLWDGEKRELKISRDKEMKRIFPSKDFINVKKENEKIGEFVFDVYNTDIVTYLKGEKIPACNVNGQTLINVELLTSCGIVSYNNDIRTIKIDLLSHDINEYLKKSQIIIPNEKIEGKTTYNGDIKDDVANGYGVITEEYEYTNGLSSSEKYFTSGLFKDGVKNGYICYSGYKIPHNGSDRRKRDYFSLAEYKDGERVGYSLSITHTDGVLSVRAEQNGNYKRECVVDPSYKYGYRIEKEGETNSWGEIISYKKIPTPKVKAVDVGDISKVYDDKENVYAFGNGNLKCDIPVLTDESKINKFNEFSFSNGKLYRNFLNGEKQLIDSDVISFSANSLYLMYMKNDNSVYTSRLNFEEGSGSEWIDGFDLSEPVQVFENAKFISNKGRYCVIDENNTLWCWSSPYYKTKYENTVIDNNPFTVKEPVKIAENVTMAECASGFIAYLKEDNSLYITKEVEDNENVFAVTEETKILDNVCDFGVSQKKILAVKSDGTLWTMGKADDYTLGIPFLREALKMTQITIFGE